MTSQARSCTNAECRFGADGKCVEGYALGDCPHFSGISIEDIEEIEEVKERAVVRGGPRVIALATGEALDRAQASALQRRRVSRGIGLIGPNNAGKTSLIASVYDLFQEGPVSGVGFAGSSTLIGFEKVCHDARAASRRGTPHTERTSLGADATFFHLDVRPADGDLISLFIGDRSGEDYLGATDEIGRASEFFELRRADTVTLLVNGEQLADSSHRHEVKAITPQIVDALVEGGAIRKGCRIAVVLTKMDSVLATPRAHAERVRREFDALAAGIAERHREHLEDVEPFVVAACPKETTNVRRGEGIDRLLVYWLQTSPPTSSAIVPMPEVEPRMIDLFAEDDEGR